MILYVILAERGILSERDIETYCTPDGRLGAHPDFGTPGIAASTGSLGHGLAIAAGQAYAELLKQSKAQTYCIVSDGEMQEGSSWEAMMMAANLGLSNLTMVIDNNDFSGLERMSEGHPAFYPLGEKIESFGWTVAACDGHDASSIHSALARRDGQHPHAVVATTVKGKGVSFMEHENLWHYRSPNSSEFALALREIEEFHE